MDAESLADNLIKAESALLRIASKGCLGPCCEAAKIANTALENMRWQRDQTPDLLAALEPFAKAADRYWKFGVPLGLHKIEGEFAESLTIGDLCRARDAYRALSNVVFGAAAT
jgi:hypothetical protein